MNPDSSPHDHQHGRDTKPWYRYPLLWLVIALPGLTAVAAITTVVIAVRHADDPVVDEWYREGRIINRSHAKEQVAQRLGIELEVSQVGAGLQARLSRQTAFPWPETVALSLRHPTIAAQDQEWLLHHQGDGIYRGDGEPLPQQGQWQVTVLPDRSDWRLYQRLIVNNGQLRIGHHGRS